MEDTGSKLSFNIADHQVNKQLLFKETIQETKKQIKYLNNSILSAFFTLCFYVAYDKSMTHPILSIDFFKCEPVTLWIGFL